VSNENLFAALRAAFAPDADSIAIETDIGLLYTWRDLDRATAMIANLLRSLSLPEGSRVAVQVEKSVEALMLYLATLRAGYVFLPLNTAYQSAEIEYFLGDATPAVVVCTGKNFGWVANDYLGIDQGPILAMIANYRNELVWEDMRECAPLRRGLQRAGFSGGWLSKAA